MVATMSPTNAGPCVSTVIIPQATPISLHRLLYPQKQTCAVQLGMSALGQKRTHAAQQKGSLFDDLIGGDQQARWNCQAKCLRRFAVDDSFELRRRLHRKVSGFCTAQDAVDIGCPLSRQIDEVSPVIHETARCDEYTDRVNRGQAMPGCECGRGA